MFKTCTNICKWVNQNKLNRTNVKFEFTQFRIFIIFSTKKEILKEIHLDSLDLRLLMVKK